MGEPAGIGPEVILKALLDPDVLALGRVLVVGDRDVLERTASHLGLPCRLSPVDAAPSRADLPPAGIRHLPQAAVPDFAIARETLAGGRASAEAVIAAIELAMAGTVDAIVTAPISKGAIHRAGYDFAGHTEMLAHYTGAKRSVMMMVGGGLRAALVTTHMALSDVPKRLTTETVLETITITHDALCRDFALPRPRLGVCGLNPHSGEAGLFGREEALLIEPAIAAARDSGIACEGPIPADVAFVQARQGRFDAIVAMYHDQGNIPVKLLGFETGVNVTLGLPIIRTSPDHGTAYDIAGQGKADPSSLTAAAHMAAAMVRSRRQGRP